MKQERKLSEICNIFSGSRPKGGAISSGVLSIGGEHISSDGYFDLSNPKYIPEKYFKNLKRGILGEGAVTYLADSL
jgi:type I restriction enzyme, S subunit